MRFASKTAVVAALTSLSPFVVAQGNIGFEIDGVVAGGLNEFKAGEIQIAKHHRRQEDTDVWWRTYVPGLPWYPATMQIGWELPDPMFGWINEALQGLPYRKSTKTFEKKRDSDIVSRQTDFFDVFMDYIVFPGCDKLSHTRPGHPKKTRIEILTRARGIVVTRPGGSMPNSPAAKTWNPANFEIKIRDSSRDPVSVQVKQTSTISIATFNVENLGGPEALVHRLVTVDDVVLTVPVESYAYFDSWFQQTLAIAPLTDPADDGARLKRTMQITYILDDGSRVPLRLEGVGIMGIEPDGADFRVRVYAERIQLMNKQ